MTRAARYGTTPFTSYRDRSEAEVVAGAQIEGPAGLAAVDDILATAHLDLAFIGPFDLSQHLGVPGDTSHPVRRRGDGRHRRPRRRQGRRHGDLGAVGGRRPPVDRRRHPPRHRGQLDGPVHGGGDRADRRVAIVAVTQSRIDADGRPVSVDGAMTTDADRQTERKPILLTVDDDPGVSRAVARDLRRHYGAELPRRAHRVGQARRSRRCAI